jgi:hypothetical protein
MWHPLRLAEDYAMADILTGGRVICLCVGETSKTVKTTHHSPSNLQNISLAAN